MATAIGATANAASGFDSQIGKDQFLKLLITQLKHQDPMEPIKDEQFVAQLAQFSTLEGVEKLNATFGDMLSLQQLTQGSSLIGKQVVFDQLNSESPGSGLVTAVHINQGNLELLVGGQAVPLSRVRGFAQA